VKQPDFTIITPSFKQLDYLGCCIASVADQGTKGSENVGMCESGKGALLRSVSAGSQSYAGLAEQLSVEHIVQDAGSPGIEEFAKKMGEQLLGKYGGERVSNLEAFEILHLRTPHGYALRIFKEKDSGMYDAVNRGLKKGTGKICAYLNCDEQYLPSSLTKIYNAFKAKQLDDVLFWGVLIIKPDGRLIAARMPVRLFLYHVMTCHLPNFTCSMFFRRSMLEKEEAWFDAKWRDCADALWVIDRLAKKTKIGRVSEYSTAFADTGANMNLSPNAIREAAEIRNRAPRLCRWAKILWVWAHWMGKLFDGAYRPEVVSYSLYPLNDWQSRASFSKQLATPFWVGRWFIRERLRWGKT
jgi:glycosyltransferase involved in cell wall biosynthesis